MEALNIPKEDMCTAPTISEAEPQARLQDMVAAKPLSPKKGTVDDTWSNVDS